LTLDNPPQNQEPGDADDPAIYVHPTDAAKSLVIGTLKDGGLSVYDLNGKVTQTISPGEPGDVRYNNVDLVYSFNLGIKVSIWRSLLTEKMTRWLFSRLIRQPVNLPMLLTIILRHRSLG
jgi:myo-inositol-hexaphosphate 3-phosphohydrolase